MKTENQALLKVVETITAKVNPKVRKQFDRIVLAGMKLMYADQMEGYLREQIASGPPAQAAGQGAAKLLGVLQTKFNGTAPIEAMGPAGVVLVCEALDVLEKLGKAEVTPELVAEAMKEYSAAYLQMLGITREKLEGMMGAAKQQDAPAAQAEQPAPSPQPGGLPLIGAQP